MITLFPSHTEVRCLKCDLELSDPEPLAQIQMLQIGTWAKKCPRCKLMTSYDLGTVPVTPREAAAIEYEEPEWKARFEAHCLRWPTWPRYLQENSAFDATMRDWRMWHWTPIEGSDKKMPAGATEAIIALAKLGVTAPRSAWNEIPHGDDTGYQHDDHMWLSISQEQWRITAIEDGVLHLGKMNFDDKAEMMQFDLNKVKWNKYIEAAVAILGQM